MKKFLSLFFALAIILTVFPVQSFAKSDKVELYGNKISVHAKQICFVGGKEENSYFGSLYDSSFKKYYYVGDETVDLKLVAEKLPELQNLVVICSGVKNLSALSDLKDLSWLGLHQCAGSEDLSFIKNLTELKKFRYTSIYRDKECESVMPVAYLKNLTELYINVKWAAIDDISSLKGLTKLKKLELMHPGGDDLAVLKNMKNLRELTLDLSSETDMAFLSSLTKLEKLDISGDTQNLSSVTGLQKLKDMSIDANDGDLSFIGDVTQLERLHIGYSSKSFTKSIGRLKNLKELSLFSINNGNPYDTSFIPELTSLESLAFFSNCDYDLDISGISKLKNLKSLELMMCQFGDLSELKKCPALEEVILYNNESPFDIKWIDSRNIKRLMLTSGDIKNINTIKTFKNLEYLYLDFINISEETIKAIKKSAPNCKIEIWENTPTDSTLKVY